MHGLALHELALDAVERRQLVVARRERLDFRLDAEQLRDESLEVRREREQQLRFLLRRQRRGLGARARSSRSRSAASLSARLGEEAPVEPQQALAR